MTNLVAAITITFLTTNIFHDYPKHMEAYTPDHVLKRMQECPSCPVDAVAYLRFVTDQNPTNRVEVTQVWQTRQVTIPSLGLTNMTSQLFSEFRTNQFKVEVLKYEDQVKPEHVMYTTNGVGSGVILMTNSGLFRLPVSRTNRLIP